LSDGTRELIKATNYNNSLIRNSANLITTRYGLNYERITGDTFQDYLSYWDADRQTSIYVHFRHIVDGYGVDWIVVLAIPMVILFTVI
jgi:hypothetical protein